MKLTVKPKVIGALGTVPQRLVKETNGFENQRKNRDDTNYCFAEIDLYTYLGHGNLLSVRLQ